MAAIEYVKIVSEKSKFTEQRGVLSIAQGNHIDKGELPNYRNIVIIGDHQHRKGKMRKIMNW